jgi:mRNA interferase MazF
MMRGDVVVVALPGDVGKPRPAIVLRANIFSIHNRISVVPCTSQLQPWRSLRVDLAPSEDNGLHIPCQAMIDRVTSVKSERARQVIGRLADADLAAIDRAVLVYLGFAE